MYASVSLCLCFVDNAGIYVQDPQLGEYKYAEFQNTCTSAQLAAKACFQDLTIKELFDLEKDPHELDNIAGLPSSEPLIAELHKRLWRYYPCQGESCP